MANNEPMHVYPTPDGGVSTPLSPPDPASLMDIPANEEEVEKTAPPADYN